MKLLAFRILALLLLSLGTANAQSVEAPAITPPPAFVVGDAWVFKRVNFNLETIYSEAVERIGADEVVFKRQSKQEAISQVSRSLEGNNREGSKHFKFPIAVNSTWEGVWARWGYTGRFKVRVRAYEKVQVPAGNFDAWKMELDSYADGGSASTHQVYWYAPSIKRIVMIESMNRGGDRDRWQEVLVAYKVNVNGELKSNVPIEVTDCDIICRATK